MMNWNKPVFEAPSLFFQPQIIWEPQPSLCCVSKQQSHFCDRHFRYNPIWFDMSLDRGTYCKLIYSTIQEGPYFLGMSMRIRSKREKTPVGLGAPIGDSTIFLFRWKWNCREITTDQKKDDRLPFHAKKNLLQFRAGFVAGKFPAGIYYIHSTLPSAFVLGVMCLPRSPPATDIAGKQVSIMRSLPPRRSLFGPRLFGRYRRLP